MSNLYDILNIPPTSGQEEVRNGYLSMSRIHHPDKSSSSSTTAFREINEAYSILSDPALRAFYDKHGYEATILALKPVDGSGTDGGTVPQGEGEAAIVPVDERLRMFEKKVRSMVRASDELEAQKFLQPSGSISIGTRLLSYRPFYRSWSHSATTFGVSLLSGRNSVSLFASSHVQRGGAAVTRTSAMLTSAVSPTLTTRAMVHLMGGKWPSAELMAQKTFTEQTLLRQTLALVDGSIVLATEWVQQLSSLVIGTLGVTVGATPGVSIELAKNRGLGSILANTRGKLRAGLTADGRVTFGGKAKFQPAPGLEIHVGPDVNVATGDVSIELAIQKQLEPLVEEQEGAFPTMLTWSLGLQYPDELTVGVKISRGGFSFNFPVELPVVESRWVFIAALAAWTFTPLTLSLASKGWAEVANRLARGKIGVHAQKEKEDEVVMNGNVDEGAMERQAMQEEANQRKKAEEKIEGLVITEARYDGVDVTTALMARVRDSALQLSSSSKSKLVGIRNPTGGHSLFVKYTYGKRVYEREFRDTEIVILP